MIIIMTRFDSLSGGFNAVVVTFCCLPVDPLQRARLHMSALGSCIHAHVSPTVRAASEESSKVIKKQEREKGKQGVMVKQWVRSGLHCVNNSHVSDRDNCVFVCVCVSERYGHVNRFGVQRESRLI